MLLEHQRQPLDLRRNRPAAYRGIARSVLASLLLGLGGASVTAAPEESLSYAYYTVDSREGESLRQALNRTSQIREDGKTFHGFTRWQINWQFKFRNLPDGACTIRSVATKLAATITLPELKSASPAMQASFASYIDALHEHEMGHYTIARNAAREIDRRIAEMSPLPSCDDLKIEANAIGYGLLDKARLEGREYDRVTGHGKTQGATVK